MRPDSSRHVNEQADSEKVAPPNTLPTKENGAAAPLPFSAYFFLKASIKAAPNAPAPWLSP